MTKLDLVDTYPKLFRKGDKISRNDSRVKLTEEELEQLRILVVGDQKLFMSRSPNSRKFIDSCKDTHGGH